MGRISVLVRATTVSGMPSVRPNECIPITSRSLWTGAARDEGQGEVSELQGAKLPTLAVRPLHDLWRTWQGDFGEGRARSGCHPQPCQREQRVMSGLTPDQVIEAKHALRGMAELLRSYYDDLREQGFSKREAMQIALEYQRQLASGSSE